MPIAKPARMKQRIWLSKSTFLRSVQCPKSLFLHKHYYNLRDEPSKKMQALFNEGFQIEEKAREVFFGHGMNVRPASPRAWAKSAEITEQLIENGQPVIYEACFVYEGIMCAVDVVTVQADGTISCYEIKRGRNIKETYLQDTALQYWVINSLGYTIQAFQLINFQGDLANDEFTKDDFSLTNVKENAITNSEWVAETIKKAESTINLNEPPKIDMGEHCYQPYQCSFVGFCTKQAQQL